MEPIARAAFYTTWWTPPSRRRGTVSILTRRAECAEDVRFGDDGLQLSRRRDHQKELAVLLPGE